MSAAITNTPLSSAEMMGALWDMARENVTHIGGQFAGIYHLGREAIGDAVNTVRHFYTSPATQENLEPHAAELAHMHGTSYLASIAHWTRAQDLHKAFLKTLKATTEKFGSILPFRPSANVRPKIQPSNPE